MSRRPIAVWRWPIAIALVSVVGLVAALVEDGAADAVGWIALAIPVGVSAWGCVRALRGRHGSSSGAGAPTRGA